MRQYSQMRGTPCISGCPCHYKRPVLPPQKKKEGVWQWQWDVVGFIVWFHTPALPQRNWQNDPVLLHGATRGYGRYHVNVGSEPLVGFRVWSEYSSVYVWIYCICACMCGLGSELNVECQGKPKPPSFSSCPSLTSLFSVICLFLLLRSFCHLASVSRPLTEVLRQLSHNGLGGINGAHFISPNLTAKTSPTASPVNQRQTINRSQLLLH